MAEPTDKRRRARPVITGRALVLGGVVILLVVLLASPLHRFLASRGDVNSAAQQLRDDQKELAQLRHERAMWNDPGYVQQQARTRLQFAMPGDTVYVVVDKGAKSDLEKSAAKAPGTSGKNWNERVWDTVQAASR
jgi:cell division protein FtsB